MYVDKMSCIVVIIVVNDVVGKTDIISISDDNSSWEEAVGSGHTLLSSDFVLSHGWNSIPTYLPEISSGARYWIGARAKHTPFVSWEGCVQWIGGPECGDVQPGGSIGDCVQNCGEDMHYFLLQDSQCRCVPKNTSCFRYTRDRCNIPCPNNPNDWCGGSNNTLSLYNTGPFNQSLNKTYNATSRNCVLLVGQRPSGNGSSIQFKQDDCENNYIRRYICKNSSFSFAEDNISGLRWLEADEKCREKNGRLYYSVSHGKLYESVFWISLRRSIKLKWTNIKDDDFPLCVSISVDNTTVSLREEPCDREYRYIYWNYNTGNHSWWRWWYPLLFLVVIILPVLFVLSRIALSRNRGTYTISTDNIGMTLHLQRGDQVNNEETIYDTTDATRSRYGFAGFNRDTQNHYDTAACNKPIYDTTCPRTSESSTARVEYISNNEYGLGSFVIQEKTNICIKT